MQFLGEQQALFARAASFVLLGEAMPFSRLRTTHPDEFGDRQQHDQPSGDEREVDVVDAAVGLGIDRRCGDVPDEPTGGEICGLPPLTRLDRDEESEGRADEDRAVRIAERYIHVGGHDGGSERPHRPSVTPCQRDRTDPDQGNGDSIEGLAVWLVVSSAERADHLEDRYTQRTEQHRLPRQPHWQDSTSGTIHRHPPRGASRTAPHGVRGSAWGVVGCEGRNPIDDEVRLAVGANAHVATRTAAPVAPTFCAVVSNDDVHSRV